MPNLNLTLSRQHFLTTALAYLGTPYRWGGDDPSGFDCSGYVLECLKSGGIIGETEDLTANQLLTRFSRCRIGTATSGALQFLCDKSGHANHVVICIDEQFQIGASGGNSATLSPADAWRKNAYIKIRPIVWTVRAVFVDPFQKESTRVNTGGIQRDGTQVSSGEEKSRLALTTAQPPQDTHSG